jgi:arsenate reductase
MPSRLYHNPHCSKSRGALALLRARGIEPDVVCYLDHAPSVDELRGLLRMLGIRARELLRAGEPEYSELGLENPALDDDSLVAAMHEHPQLIERPVFVHGQRAMIGRPPERVLDLLD